MDDKQVIEQFHKLYFASSRHLNSYWLGVQAAKCPLDLWIYQEIIHECRPDVIIETGTFMGGSSLFLASICDLMGSGRVLTIDIQTWPHRPQHPRITYLLGSSTSNKIIEELKGLIDNKDRVMVILDSNHSKEHVLTELEIYSQIVTRGQCLAVEDTNTKAIYPMALPPPGDGPVVAIQEFLEKHKDFVVESRWEKFLLSFNTSGYLRKISKCKCKDKCRCE